MTFPVFKQEKIDGLEDIFKAKSCIVYCSLTQPDEAFKVSDKVMAHARNLLKAENQNQIDLYYFKSLLASAGWNLNEDVFDTLEMWQARATPEDKPFNFEHNCLDILGHHTANFAVDEKMNILDDNLALDDVPEKFHIITKSVIYKRVDNEEQQNKIDKIIAEIPQGLWYVSMEAWFKNFDYAVLNIDTNESKIIARNSKTAFLTKYLKAFGGKGVYENYRIGRLLRGITFAGSGLVKNPANPESIIFRDTNSTKSFTYDKNVVYSSLKSEKLEKKMPEFNLDEYLQKIKDRDNKIAELEKQLGDVNVKASLAKIDDLTKKLGDTSSLANDYKAKFDAASAEVSSLKTKVADLTRLSEEAGQALKVMQTEQKKTKRIQAVASAYKVENDKAELIVANLMGLDDTAFDNHIKFEKERQPSVGNSKVVSPLDSMKPEPSFDGIIATGGSKLDDLFKEIREVVYNENVEK